MLQLDDFGKPFEMEMPKTRKFMALRIDRDEGALFTLAQQLPRWFPLPCGNQMYLMSIGDLQPHPGVPFDPQQDVECKCGRVEYEHFFIKWDEKNATSTK